VTPARTPRLALAIQVYALLGAPLAWTTQLVVGFGLTEAACGPAGRMWNIAIDTWESVIFGLIGLFSESGPRGAYKSPDALAVLLALLASLPYFARRRAPVAVLAVNIVAICALGIIGYPFNVQAQMALVGVYTVGSHSEKRKRVVGVIAVAAGLLAAAVFGFPNSTGADLVLTGAIYAGAYLFGSTVRNRHTAASPRRPATGIETMAPGRRSAGSAARTAAS